MRHNRVSGQRTIYRSLVHFLVGITIAITVFVLPKSLMLLLAASGVFLYLLVDLIRLNNPGLNHRFQSFLGPLVREYEATRLTSASFLFVSCLFCLAVFRKEIAVLAISFVSVGDPAAHIIGERFGRMKVFNKTLEGSLACLVACSGAAVAWTAAGLNLPFWIIAVGIISAAIAESLPVAVDDNMRIPVLSGIMMWIFHIFI